MGAVDVIAFLNSIDLTGSFAVQDAAVVLPRLHHHGKVGQLIGAVINIEAVEVVFQDALCRVPLVVSCILIHLHQHIESVDQNVAAAHARVNDLDIPHIFVLTLLLDFIELFAHFLCLRSFGQIVFPLHLLGKVLFSCDPLFLSLVPSHLVQTTPISKDTFVLPLVDEETA